jgi:Family of unknown function (DUF6084)
MPDLDYQIVGAESRPFAAAPTLLFKLRVSEADSAGPGSTPIHSVILRCQIRIEPTRRAYSIAEKERLRELFGTSERWGQTVRSMLWTHVSVVVPGFEGSADVGLPVSCNYDFNLAATRYFAALEGGDLPLCFLFSGTIFYESRDNALQVAQISWEKEADFRLQAATWRAMMEHYYPNSAWLCLRKDVFDRLDQYRDDRGLTTWELALERLLAASEESVTS